eukprot:1835084-Amphidinium_carterae.1
MESLLGEHTMVATSTMNSVSDVVQQLLTTDQVKVDDFLDGVEQQLTELRSDLSAIGEGAAIALVAAKEATLALAPSPQDTPAKKPDSALALLSGCNNHMQAALADGCISVDEVAAAVLEACQAANGPASLISTSTARWRQVFNHLDEDGDGCIRKDEWIEVIGPLSPSSKKHTLVLMEGRAQATSQMKREIALDHILWAKRTDSSCSRANIALDTASRDVAALLGKATETSAKVLDTIQDAAILSSSLFTGINKTLQENIGRLPSALLPRRAFEPISDGSLSALAVATV